MLARERIEAVREPLDRPVDPLPDCLDVNLRLAKRHAELAGLLAGCDGVNNVQERFGGNAAFVEAQAAERTLSGVAWTAKRRARIDQDRGDAQLRGPECRAVSGR